jgi:hypothetical protein
MVVAALVMVVADKAEASVLHLLRRGLRRRLMRAVVKPLSEGAIMCTAQGWWEKVKMVQVQVDNKVSNNWTRLVTWSEIWALMFPYDLNSKVFIPFHWVFGGQEEKKERKERKKGEIMGNQAHFLYHILILLLVAV